MDSNTLCETPTDPYAISVRRFLFCVRSELGFIVQHLNGRESSKMLESFMLHFGNSPVQYFYIPAVSLQNRSYERFLHIAVEPISVQQAYG